LLFVSKFNSCPEVPTHFRAPLSSPSCHIFLFSSSRLLLQQDHTSSFSLLLVDFAFVHHITTSSFLSCDFSPTLSIILFSIICFLFSPFSSISSIKSSFITFSTD
ncbi:hypothetical protein VIGAN_08289900, partial [Vigna angularis var. angularis]